MIRRRRPSVVSLQPSFRRQPESSRNRVCFQSAGSRRARGFSLLEVLAAFVVLALIMTVMLRSLGLSTRSSALSAAHAEAARRAENLLAAAELNAALQPGVSNGVLEGRWRWRQEVSVYEEAGRDFSAATNFRPLRVVVEVAWTRDGREHSVGLSTLRLAKLQ